jgi:hypothetical protein
MITLFHLINGEQLIGFVHDRKKNGTRERTIDISDPMYVERTLEGGMRLRDVLALSDTPNDIHIMEQNVLFTSVPLPEMVEYYKMASTYSNSITKVLIKAQILESAVDMKRMLEEDGKEISTAIKNSGGLVH